MKKILASSLITALAVFGVSLGYNQYQNHIEKKVSEAKEETKIEVRKKTRESFISGMVRAFKNQESIFVHEPSSNNVIKFTPSKNYVTSTYGGK